MSLRASSATTVARAGRESSRGLTRGDFRRVARNGFGNPHNSYPHSLNWFRDRLFVSTTRDNLAIAKLSYTFEVPMAIWPVPLPASVRDLDLRAQIWRYDPLADTWTNAYTAPIVTAPDGRRAPITIAMRAMVVFQGASDPAPALYGPTHPPQPLKHLGSSLLRTFDGENFELLGEIGANLITQKFRSFRALLPFKGRLFTAPAMLGEVPKQSNVAGVALGQANVAGVALVLTSADPAQGKWELANIPYFGDANNAGIFEMAVANGFLYAGVINIAEGFQLWKTDGEGRPPYRWTRVLSRGAYRGRLNQGAVAMTAFGDHLYVTAAVQGGGYDRANNVGPAPAELLRVAPDDSWDLIAGDARNTPFGMKVPLSGYGAGFGNPFAGYMWRMCVHDGWLYLGTFDSSVFLRWLPETNVMPDYVKNVFDATTIDAFVQRLSGFDLWRTRDGLRWTQVTNNGFGNCFNYGARTMVSTPHGLFVGATNPFGPDVAIRRAGGWVYEPNPAGGAEIWLGSPGGGGEPEVLGPVELPEMIMANGNPRDDAATCEALLQEYYGGTGFRHLGLWRDRISDPRQACENLVEELLSFFPEKSGTIVDVGCGNGATTEHLLRYWPSASVTGIATDTRAFRTSCRALPAVRFLLGVPRLRLPDTSADAVICVEGLAGVADKAAALREMLRILRPGGRVALADPLYTTPPSEVAGPGAPPTTAADYGALLAEAGFTAVDVVDATHEAWVRFSQHRTLYFAVRMLAKQLDPQLIERLRDALPGGRSGISAYVLATGRKPDAGDDSR